MMLSKEGIPVDTIKLPVVADILVPTTLDTDCFSRLRKLEIPVDDMIVPVVQIKFYKLEIHDNRLSKS